MANKRNGTGDGSPAPKKPRREESKRLTPPLLSPSDKKKYRHLQLPNGLRVLLISDQSVDANPTWSHMNFEVHSMRLDPEHKIRDVLPPNILDPENKIRDVLPPNILDPENKIRDVLPPNILQHHLSIDVNNSGLMAHSSSGTNLSREIPIESKAAMCLVVNSGSIDDPPQYEGLAHFTEHMVHYGSKKYPSDVKYWNFINNHGSHINAYTQFHTTTYQVAVNPDFLREGLEMFSYCISEPLFDPNTTNNEVQAVDSEFHLSSGNDIRKIMDIIRSTMKKGHDLSKFACGNAETLKGKDLLRQLQQFHADNYVAKRMTFAIQSTDSLDTLQEIVETSMNCIKSGTPIKEPQSISSKDVFNEDSFSKLYTIKGDRKLLLIWKFDSSAWKDSELKPLKFLEILMNDCGVGGLPHIFTERGWSTGMYSGCTKCEFTQNNYCSIFTNEICLTESGEKNVDRIVQYIFDFIDMLLDTPEHYFEDRWEDAKDCSKQNFAHCGNGAPLSNTHYAARKMMTHGPVATFLSKDIVFEGEYKPEPLTNVLKSISRKKTLYIQFTSSELAKNSKKEKMQYSMFEYTREDIPRGFLKEVKDWNLQFPGENPFITSRTQIRHNAEPQPRIDEKLAVILKPNTGITTSKCRYQVYMHSLESERAPFHRQLLPLLMDLLELKMQNELKLASRAGIKTKISQCHQGICLSLVGFPENMPDVLKKFCEIFNKEAFSVETFEIIKQFGQSQYNSTIKSPAGLMGYLYRSLHAVDKKSILETPNKISTLTQGSFAEYIKLFKSSMYIVCILEGNVSEDEAIEVKATLQDIRYGQAEISAFYLEPTQLILPHGERTIRMRAVNSSNCNNMILNLYQTSVQDRENEVMCNIAARLMRGPAFTLLRTRQQLAYQVQVVPSRGIPVMFLITMQTPNSKHTLCSLNQKIDAFLLTFYDEFLSKMTAKEFRNCKTNMNLQDVVSLESMKSWYEANIYDPNFNKLRKLSMQVVGSSLPKVGKACTCEFCSSIEFKRSGNTDVEFAAYKRPNTPFAQTHKLIDSIEKFHEEEVRNPK